MTRDDPATRPVSEEISEDTLAIPPLHPQDFDFEPGVCWVMHCAEGPVPRSAARAVAEFMQRETQPWHLRWQEDFQDIPQRVRHLGARLLGTEPADITLGPTTSSGLTTLAQTYPWREGDEVVLPLGEFPSNYWPWHALRARGVALRQVPLWSGQMAGAAAWASSPPIATGTGDGPEDQPEGRLLAALGPRTRILAVSWVRFQDGLTLDLGRLAAGCRARGVDLVVDGIQGAGTRRLVLDGVAAFVSGGHKGLLAPQGLGLLWTRADFRARLAPAGSWLSVEEATDFERPSTDFDRPWKTDGSVFEQGVPNLLAGVALAASLGTLNDAGVEGGERGVGAIADHVAWSRARLIRGLAHIPRWAREAERLAALDREGRLASVVALHHGRSNEPDRGRSELDWRLARGKDRGIWASIREGYLRIALHGWHTVAELDRVLDWLEEVP